MITNIARALYDNYASLHYVRQLIYILVYSTSIKIILYNNENSIYRCFHRTQKTEEEMKKRKETQILKDKIHYFYLKQRDRHTTKEKKIYGEKGERVNEGEREREREREIANKQELLRIQVYRAANVRNKH